MSAPTALVDADCFEGLREGKAGDPACSSRPGCGRAIAYYLEQRAVDAALGLIDALEKAYGHIGRHPVAGSPFFAHELNLPGLWFWLVPGYPYVAFYVKCDDTCQCVARAARSAGYPIVDGRIASRQ